MNDRWSLRAWGPAVAPVRSYPALLAAYARYLQKRLPSNQEVPPGRVSAALAALRAASESTPSRSYDSIAG